MALKNEVIARNQHLNILANENCALKLQLQRNIYFVPSSQVQSQQSGVLVNALNQQLARMKTELDSKYSEIQKLKQQNDLLTQSMKKALQCLVEKRNAAGVSKENNYLFARANSGSIGHIRGCDCLRKLVSEADFQYPDKINSTGLC